MTFAKMIRTTSLMVALSASLSVAQAGEPMKYQACPILRSYYPPPAFDKAAPDLEQITASLTAEFDELVRTGKHEVFGSVTPNTTSFSVVLFSGDDDAAAKPAFFEYHYTAREMQNHSRVSADTVFPTGTLTQLLTVYTWLVDRGDGDWNTPITEFLPELVDVVEYVDEPTVDWKDVTIGALAGHMSGLARNSYACTVGKRCDKSTFIEKFATVRPLFLSDTTPVISNAAFQLLAFALENQPNGKRAKGGFEGLMQDKVFRPLNMSQTASLASLSNADIFGDGLDGSEPGEPAALSILSSTHDLAVLGHAILSSRQMSSATTRRWLQPVADTSNVRNGVGRPWEIFHSGATPITPITDAFLKSGLISNYASYFGLVPDSNVGFAVLAHDTGDLSPDLNVHVDILSVTIPDFQTLAAKQMANNYVGLYHSAVNETETVMSLDVTEDGPGLSLETLIVGGVDLRSRLASRTRIALDSLDLKLYPSNALWSSGKKQQQFVAVFQDKSAPVDAGTPTCITWMDVDKAGADFPVVFVFDLAEDGRAKAVTVPAIDASFQRGLA